ncbi:MAG TPA: OmpA family protein [Candidatus Binatia bacterium]|nr:OmpA family protein [Candidatus Binatia bacterium]
MKPLAFVLAAVTAAALAQDPPAETLPPPPASALAQHRQVGRLPEEVHDADGDGIPDIDDNCPGTDLRTIVQTRLGPQPLQVDGCGCPVDPCAGDADGDGVRDCDDACPGTFRGLKVQPDGCPAPLVDAVRFRLDVKFEFDRDGIQPGFEGDLLKLRALLEKYPEIRVRLEGHTDAKGSDAYNQALSERRARRCRDFILSAGGIDPARVEAGGFGESQPIAGNDTDEGRAQNRRTVAEIQFERTITPANDQPPPLEGLVEEKK